MKTSFVCTVFNEESSIDLFIKSLLRQSHMPYEIIIVDGGSTDNTMSVISNFQFPISNNKIKIASKKGNRSVGRNEAIKNASGDIILCSDAGCILEKDWIKNIIEPFLNNPKIDVVAGYYDAHTSSIFEKCLVPYVFVMPDKININNFLPSSRSIAFKKDIWEKVGRFPENLSDNEDYVFAKKIKNSGAKVIFQKKAIVYWIPRKNIKEAVVMFYRFAKGDMESRIIRPKVILIFVRYFIGLVLLYLVFHKTFFSIPLLMSSIIIYIMWSIKKNYKYVNDLRGTYILPALQIISDIVIMLGSIRGLINIIRSKKQWAI